MKKTDDPKKKKVTAANTAAMTDYKKKAAAVNAPAGTKLAPEGSAMRAKQNSYAKAKQTTNASSTNRDARTTAIAAEMKKEDHAFNNKAYDKIKSKIK
jgi:hypothetical protein